MASIKIRSDKENLVPELRQKQTNNNAMAAQQKRNVLGAVHHNNKVNKAPPLGKQALKKSKSLVQKQESVQNNENRKNVVVPVAQFEAFTVYEDDEQRTRVDERLRLISMSNVYKTTAEDRFISKTELAEFESQRILEKQRQSGLIKQKLQQPGSPMSVMKCNNENVLAENVILNSKSCKDIFFEMEEYREDIYSYLREHELQHRPKPGYIVKQPDVTENMRAVLVDWLVEVAEEYNMQTETLYLAVNFIDRFLSYMSVVRAKLQLVGTAAMFIASKYEEMYAPEVSEFVYITDDTYDKHQVIRMEHLILRVLGFDLSVPTPLTFINAICVATKQTEKIMYLSMFLSEMALLEVEPYLQFLPSMIASSAVALSRHTLFEEAWSDEMERSTGYCVKQLKSCVDFLYEIFVKAPTHAQHAIQDKYKSAKYMKVSAIIPRTEMIKFD